ncbi:hypothetical protein MMC30_004494 [Trapelia coarctata]|nr:hypothetical protein [Trapelia coarctata]
MPPPPLPKRIKRPAKILDEDTYTEALSDIIARDFFPGLAETEAQREYLEALDSSDPEWIEAAGQKLHDASTPGPDGRRLRGRRGTSMTPIIEQGGETPTGWTGATPGSVVLTTSTATTRTTKPTVDTNLSLSAFQQKYTSEDNESFYKLLDKQNRRNAEKHDWLWPRERHLAVLGITSSGSEDRDRLKVVLRSTAEDLEREYFEVTSLNRHHYKDPYDSRSAMPDSWKSRPDNNFMFRPSSIEDELPTVQQNAEGSSRAGPKAVVYDNTRLPTATSTTADPAVPPSPTMSAIRDAIAGRPRITDSEIDDFGGETPRVNGYKFVDSEPSPAPSDMTSSWADLGSSYLGKGDATPNPFKIKEGSKREALHHRIVDKVAKGKRQEKRFAEIKTPVSQFAGSPRVAKGGLTPAGHKLLGQVDQAMWRRGIPDTLDEYAKTYAHLFEGRTPKSGPRLRMVTPTPNDPREITEAEIIATMRKRS